MTKEEAKLKLREAQDNLRQAEVILEMHENGMREIKEDIRELKAIINKKDDWKLVEVPDGWHQLYLEKITLMAEMMRFAYIRNKGWVPDWKEENQKWGLNYDSWGRIQVDFNAWYNDFIFGIAVKSEEIAQGMLEEFGKRIEEIYNKQY